MQRGRPPCAPTPASPANWSRRRSPPSRTRSEEHTSELQSPCNLVCRLLLEKKKKKKESAHPLLPLATYPTNTSIWANMNSHGITLLSYVINSPVKNCLWCATPHRTRSLQS